MRTRKIVAISAVFAVLLVAFTVMAFSEPERLSISVTPTSYTARAGQVFVSFVVTNTSNVAIEYADPHPSTLRVFGEDGWRESHASNVVLSKLKVLDSGDAVTTFLMLPLDVRKWQIAYEVQTPSPQLKLWRKLPPKVATRIWGAVSKVVSSQPGKIERVWSGEIDVQKWKNTHQQELDRAKAPLGMNSGEPPWR